MKNVVLFYGLRKKLMKSAEKCERLCFFPYFCPLIMPKPNEKIIKYSI